MPDYVMWIFQIYMDIFNGYLISHFFISYKKQCT